MSKQDFINRVLQVLNEADAMVNGSVLTGGDMTKVLLYIENLFPSAWRRAVNLLPRTWFKTQSFVGQIKVVDAPLGIGYVLLPSDFLVLSNFKMEGWKTSCLEAAEETPQINKKQANEYTRGTPQRPVCVLRLIVHEEELSRALYYYSLPASAEESTHVIEHALYIPNITELTDDTVIDDKLFDPLAYLCASSVLTSFEKENTAKLLDNKVLEMI